MSQRAFPQLRMTDWRRTRRFYVEGLGFSVDWEHRFEDGFPVFAQVTREGVSLFLTEHAGDCEVGGAAYRWATCDAPPQAACGEAPKRATERSEGVEWRRNVVS